MTNLPQTTHTAQHITDAIAAMVVIGTIGNLLPPIAALFTIIWTAMRVWEMATGEPFSHSWLARKVTGR